MHKNIIVTKSIIEQCVKSHQIWSPDRHVHLIDITMMRGKNVFANNSENWLLATVLLTRNCLLLHHELGLVTMLKVQSEVLASHLVT